MYHRLDQDYKPYSSFIPSPKRDLQLPPMIANTEIQFPEIPNNRDNFHFPQTPSKNVNWTLVGYLTSVSIIEHSVYKLYEKYNQNTYLYDYLVLLENNVFVQLESIERRIRHNSILSDGKIPGKNGLGDYLVHLYKTTNFV